MASKPKSDEVAPVAGEGYAYRYTGGAPETFPTLSGVLDDATLEPDAVIDVPEPVLHARLAPCNDRAVAFQDDVDEYVSLLESAPPFVDDQVDELPDLPPDDLPSTSDSPPDDSAGITPTPEA